MRVFLKTTCFALVLAGMVTIGSSRAYAQAAASNNSELSVLMQKAKSGDAAAQTELGTHYYLGRLVKKDAALAAAWFRKAAEQGNALAQAKLGALYYSGKGVQQDYAQAAVWYRKAAEQGNAEAQLTLGVLYYSGKGGPQDYAQAAIWFRKAAEQGNAEAQSFLAGQYGLGNGVPQDYAESYFWYDIALAGNNTDKVQQRELDINARGEVASHLTPAKLQEEQSRATRWFAQHPSNSNAQ